MKSLSEIDYRQMQKMSTSIDNFQKLERIGKGTYGYVYKAINTSTQEIVALKRIILHHEETEGFPLTSIREIKILHRLKHINIIHLLDVAVGRKRDAVFLLFEYCENDLSMILRHCNNPPPFQASEIKCLLFQLLSALEYLHKNWIVHRDIKLSNLLYNARGELKLCDFGLARTISSGKMMNLTPLVVTLWYRAPELLLGASNYSFAVDMWSVGCVFAELLLLEPLFCGMTELEQLLLVFATLGTPTEQIWPNIIDLPVLKNGQISLLREKKRFPYNHLSEKFPMLSANGLELMNLLFTYDPQIRISAHVALQNSYFLSPPFPKSIDLMPAFPPFQQEKQR